MQFLSSCVWNFNSISMSSVTKVMNLTRMLGQKGLRISNDKFTHKCINHPSPFYPSFLGLSPTRSHIELKLCIHTWRTIEEYSAIRGVKSIVVHFEKNGKTGFCLSLLAMACSDPKVTLTHALNITSQWNFYRM